jgi:hypothetical protein
MTVTFSPLHLTVNGKRTRVSYVTGPWVDGVDPATIKIRPWTGNHFGAEVRKAFAVENNSDAMTDYFEGDCIRLLPGHPLYDAANAAAPR